MAKAPASTTDGPTDAEKQDAALWHRWKAELDYALKDKDYKAWCERSEKIVKRYRDQRPEVQQSARRFNILWSNVQTLKPAVLARPPKVLAERRFLDRDPVGRLASMILERCLNNQIETGYFFESAQQGVIDHLLAGMGVIWVRYEPQFEPAKETAENKKLDAADDDKQDDGDGTPYQRVSSERVCIDYVFWKDFLWGPARFWNERPWVSRRVWKTHSEIAEAYYKGDMGKAKKINLDYSPNVDANDAQTVGYFKKAELWQFWNLADHTVYTMAPGTPGIMLQVEKDPVLKLEGFWPVARPAFATQTNETIVPVPDYVQYQDQAQELDDLTNRISVLTTALKVAGVYDNSIPALQRIMQDGTDNKLIGVDQWAAFAEKGGIPGAISFVPLKEIADTLIGLYDARSAVKADLYEITGMSDIVRGQGEQNETATAQRIKGQFASMRLEDRRGVVNTWLLDTIRIMGEIVAEMFSEDTLLKMSGVDLKIADDVRRAVEKVPQPPKPEPPQMPEGAPQPSPEQQQQMQAAMQQAEAQGQAAFQQMQQQVAAQTQAKGMNEFTDAVALLKNDKMRGFRIDIETDSTIVSDAQADKESAVELMTGVMQGLTAAGPIVMTAPELMKPIGDLMMWSYRKFRVGRSVEAGLEDALDQINDRIEAQKNQPPPPDPQMQAIQAKSQAEQDAIKAKTTADLAATQAKAKADLDRQQAEADRAAQAHDEMMQQNADKFTMAQQLHDQKMELLRAQQQAAADEALRKVTEHNQNMYQSRVQHDQIMEKATTEAKTKRDGVRSEAGLPPEDSMNAVIAEMTATREDATKVMVAQADSIKELGQSFGQAISTLAETLAKPKSIELPDGRVVRQRTDS